MKNKSAYILSLAAGGMGLVLVSGCIVEGPPPPPPYVGVVTTAPPPPPDVTYVVPDDYTWDGYEYVGVVGDQYYYLGPGSVWIICDPIRVQRFHAWVGVHPDWRVHAVRNDRYRYDAHGHYYPRGGQVQHGHEHDHDHEH